MERTHEHFVRSALAVALVLFFIAPVSAQLDEPPQHVREAGPVVVTETDLSNHVRSLLLALPLCARTVPARTAPSGAAMKPRAAVPPGSSPPTSIHPHVRLLYPAAEAEIVSVRGVLDHELDRACVDRFLTAGVLDWVVGTADPLTRIETEVAFPPPPRSRFRRAARYLGRRLSLLLRHCPGAVVRLTVSEVPGGPLTHELWVQAAHRECVEPIVERELHRLGAFGVRRRVRQVVRVRIPAGEPTPTPRVVPGMHEPSPRTRPVIGRPAR